MMSIKLSIEGIIPKRPMRQLREISTSEALEITFLWRYFGGLESVNHFRHLDVSHVRYECIQGCLVFFRLHTLPCYRLQSANTTKIMPAEVQGRATTIEGGTSFRSKHKVNGGRGIEGTLKTFSNLGDVSSSKDGAVIDGDTVRAKEGPTGSAKKGTKGGTMETVDVGAFQARTRLKRKTERRIGIQLKRNGDSGELSEKNDGDFKVREINCSINSRGIDDKESP
jgi:hypothetical protein